MAVISKLTKYNTYIIPVVKVKPMSFKLAIANMQEPTAPKPTPTQRKNASQPETVSVSWYSFSMRSFFAFSLASSS